MGIIIFILGLMLGSFLNVVIYRLPKNESIVFPGSHCPLCGHPLRFYDNIPVLSYFFLRGQCRDCQAKISLQYPMVELLTAVSLFILYLKFNLSVQFLAYSVLILFLIPITVIDWKTYLILNKLTLPGFILGIVLILGFQIETWKTVLLGGIGGGALAIFFVILGKFFFRKDSLGYGDVKLLVMIGIYVGFMGAALGLFLGSMAALIFILGRLVKRQLKLGDTIPFGPFIAIGTFVYLIFGKTIVNWYVGLF